MNEQQKAIEEFIDGIKEDLMEIYNVSDEEATSLINNFKLHTLIDKHGELVAHYPSQELAKMIFEKSINKLDEQEYIRMVREELKKMYGLSEDEITSRMENWGFDELFEDDKEYFYHYQPEIVAVMIYNRKIL